VLAGLSYGKLIGVNKDMVGAGLWYRTGDAMSPYLFIYGNEKSLNWDII
jgi:hypothetical protein